MHHIDQSSDVRPDIGMACQKLNHIRKKFNTSNNKEWPTNIKPASNVPLFLFLFPYYNDDPHNDRACPTFLSRYENYEKICKKIVSNIIILLSKHNL